MQTTSRLYVNDIITDAFDFIRIGTEFTNLTGRDEERGLKLINELLSEFNADGGRLPFFTTISFPLVALKQRYLIGLGPEADVNEPYMIEVIFVNLLNAGLRYSVDIISDMQALSTTTEQITAFLPGWVRVFKENDDLGNTYTVLQFLHAPDQDYTCEVRGKPKVLDVGLTDDLTYFPKYYHTYIKLELARRLIPYYGREDAWTTMTERMYQESIDTIRASVKHELEVVPGDALLYREGYLFGSTLGVRR